MAMRLSRQSENFRLLQCGLHRGGELAQDLAENETQEATEVECLRRVRALLVAAEQMLATLKLEPCAALPAQVTCLFCGLDLPPLDFLPHFVERHLRSALLQVRKPTELQSALVLQGPELDDLWQSGRVDDFVAKLRECGAGPAQYGSPEDLLQVAESYVPTGQIRQGADRRINGACRALASVLRAEGGPAAVAALLETDLADSKKQFRRTKLWEVLTKLGLEAQLRLPMWHAVALAAVAVVSRGCRVIVASSFEVRTFPLVSKGGVRFSAGSRSRQ